MTHMHKHIRTRNWLRRLALLAILLTSLALALTGAAATPAAVDDSLAVDYAASWFTHDGGGGASSGGSYTILGTIGQPDASPTDSAGGSYTVNGGFWQGELLYTQLYLPMVKR